MQLAKYDAVANRLKRHPASRPAARELCAPGGRTYGRVRVRIQCAGVEMPLAGAAR